MGVALVFMQGYNKVFGRSENWCIKLSKLTQESNFWFILQTRYSMKLQNT